MRKYISIGITESCNLSCIYCYERHKTRNRMSLEMIDRILESELSSVSTDEKYDSVEINPFGGEPFLYFEAVDHIVGYIRAHLIEKPIIVYIITNGTLVHGEIQKWLLQNKDLVVCGVSMDGTKKAHDFNRSNSYDTIDWQFFSNNYPDQPIKMTVSRETIYCLAENVIHCHNLGFKVNCNLAYGLDFSDVKYRTVLEEQLNELVQHYLKNPKIEPCSMLGRTISARKDTPQFTHKWCGAGSGTVCYDTYGAKYPCQFFQPLSIGNKSREMVNVSFEEEFSTDLLDEKCKSCSLEPSCPTCYGQNFFETGNIHHRSEALCILTKVTIKARIFLLTELWKRGLIKYSGEELSAILDSIVIITESGDLEY